MGIKEEEKRQNKGKNSGERAKKRAERKKYFSVPHYLLLIFVCTVLRLRFNASSVKTKALKQQKKKGAMLVLCNHTSALDFGYFTPPFFFKKISFVVAENMMYSTPIFATVIKGYKAITKKQFFADFTCIKNIKKYLDAGISVVICPEGKVAADGRTGPIPPSIARLVKWLGYPVATVVNKGAGLTRPKWAYNGRTGKIVSCCDMLFTAEETKTLSDGELMKRIECALDHNEHLYQIETGLKFRGKRYAEGLERLCYKCPKCGAEFSLKSEGDTVTCGECGNAIRYLRTGPLVPADSDSVCPERIDLWADSLRASVAEEIKAPDFRLTAPVNLFLENASRNGYRYVAAGTLTLDSEKLEYVATQDRRPVGIDADYKISAMLYNADGKSDETEPVEEEFKRLTFPIRNFVTIANIPGDSLDLYDEKHTYRMMFPAQKASTKFVLCIEAFHQK